jgi:uncharacterized membrane protein
MTEFLFALTAFLVAHMLPAAPPVRTRLVAVLGDRAYTAVYSAISLGLLAWLIAAAMRAPTTMIWEPQRAFALIPFFVMPLALWLLIAGVVEANPLSISFSSKEEPGGVVGITRHPILWGFGLWSASHIPATGHVVSVALFGALTLFALIGIVRLEARAKARLGERRWRELAATTSAVPFGAFLAGRGDLRTTGALIVSGLAALAIWAWFVVQGHELIVGIDPLARL